MYSQKIDALNLLKALATFLQLEVFLKKKIRKINRKIRKIVGKKIKIS